MMKQKNLTMIIVCVMAILFCCRGKTVQAANYPTSGECGDNLHWSINPDTGVLNISGSGDMTSAPWQIQSGSSYYYGRYGGKLTDIRFYGQITSICDNAFRGSAVTSVTIPDSVTVIGKNAFLNCGSLTTLKLGSRVQNIDDVAFGDCVNLAKITIPNSVERIGKWAFSGCNATNVTFGSQTCLKIIDQEGFGECAFTSFTLPATVETLGSGAFFKCSSLKSFTFASGSPITRIPDSLFSQDSALQTVVLPGGVESIGNSAFSSCNKLTSFTFGQHLRSIGNYAFYACPLENVTFPDSLEFIGEYAFPQAGYIGRDYVTMGGLKSVTFGSGLKTIGKGAFKYCNMTTLHIPASVETIGSLAFSNNASLRTVTFDPDSRLTYASDMFAGCAALTEVTFGNRLETLEQYAFRGCTALRTVHLGNSLRTIQKSAFTECTALESVILPATVTEIQTTFSPNANLSSLTLDVNAPLASLTDGFAQGCAKLESFVIPNRVPRVGSFTFADCTSLREITIGRGVTEIGEYAFVNCTSLKQVHYMGSADEWNTLCYHIGEGNDALLNASVTFAETVSIPDEPPVSLSITSLPCKTVYVVGQPFEPDGLMVLLHYANGATRQLIDGFAYTPMAFDTTGTQTVTVSYENLTATFPVRIIEPPRIITQPYDGIGSNGSLVKFSIEAVGEGLTYQWQKGQYAGDEGDYWTNIDSTDSFCRYELRHSNYNPIYLRCIVADQYGNRVISRTINLLTGFAISTQPSSSKTGDFGQPLTYQCSANAYGNLTYQWQLSSDKKSWQSVPADCVVNEDLSNQFIRSSCTLTLTEQNVGQYLRCVVSDSQGHTATSQTVRLKCNPPTIQQQPQSVTRIAGNTFSMSVTATGKNLTYLWQFSDDSGKTWVDTEQTTSIFTDTMTEAMKNRMMRCVIKDAGGSTIISKTASIYLNRVKITSQPQSVTGLAGDSVTFRVTAEGGNSYQWQISDDKGVTWNNVSCTSTIYETVLTKNNSGRYVRCYIANTNHNHVAKTNAVYMKVSSLTISRQPVDVQAAQGEAVTFRIGASGPGITYQWQLSDDQGTNWRNSSNQTDTYSTTISSKNDGRFVRCVVSDKYGNSIASNAACMTSTSTVPVITAQPASVTALKGDLVTFRIKATGSSLRYQWQLSDNKGASWRDSSNRTDTYCTTLSDTNNTRYLRCIVSDAYGHSVKSNAAYMKISSLQITKQPVSVKAGMGERVSFQVTAQGPGTLTYQWQLSDDGSTWRNSSVKTASYSTTLSAKNNGRSLRCLVTDKYGNTLISKVVTMKAA
ncbi:MAG: leucine-rich repeat protein [Clostridia bacterium]|nr:leucine-rich repeat protein [Clostridia bacterium]